MQLCKAKILIMEKANHKKHITMRNGTIIAKMKRLNILIKKNRMN